MARFGCWLDLPSPLIAEMAGDAGFGFVVIDLEHGPMSLETATLCLIALRAHAATLPIVRVTEGTEGQIKRALDAGARAVMVPRVESPAQAEEMVRFFRYPPRGVRGSAQLVVRATRYSRDAAAYTETFAQTHLLALQIESAVGLEACADIAAVDGVGMLFFGPADYAASIGVGLDHEDVRAAARAVCQVAAQNGLKTGTVLFPGTSVAELAEMGMSHIAVTGDLGALVSGFDAALASARAQTEATDA
ncbi:MAG: aldolase/citrate lyase family protein [Pseudomonadota bacterium]